MRDIAPLTSLHTSYADPGCNLPLGITSGDITMDQFITLSFHDYATYPSEAKLNSSGGYRASKMDNFALKIVGVKFKKETIVTGVAIQGFGDPDVQEWVEKFVVKFIRYKGVEEEFILDSNGRPKVNVLLPFKPQYQYACSP